MRNSWQKEFSTPTSAYRAKPFWAWNGKLEEKELRRQVRLLGKMGFGGFFMHSRTGLATPYLSDEWFNLVKNCIDEAARSGMEAWLYDEDRWPSGAAGGLVTRKPQFRMKYLEMKVLPAGTALPRDNNPIAAFSAKLNSGKISAMERLRPEVDLSATTAKSVEKILFFSMKSHAPEDWYNGQTYLDVLNPAAVNEFIKVTHESYRKHAGNCFGKTVPGIFTDEPNYFRGLFGYVLPWTKTLPVVFKRRYGYDLLDRLPELFFLPEGVNCSQVRYNFMDCLAWMFTDSFSRQIGEWCGRNNLLFTGHVVIEDSLREQTVYCGSAMRFYEHMQSPGMDLLTEHWRVYDTAKQVSSAARQFGRKWRLSETDGCTGWDFSFAGHKALGDWQAALGINVRCPHLSWYTMEGEAKRDYPASIFYQSPWWKDYRMVEDYFARIHVAMTRGEEIRDLLVIHPIESVWGTCRICDAGWMNDPGTVQYDRQLQDIRDALLSNHIDFDYGDEDIMSRHARVIAGPAPEFKNFKVHVGPPLAARRLFPIGSRTASASRGPTSEADKSCPSVDGTHLIIGKANYKAVLVPPLIIIRSSTLSLLRKFRSAGGLVVCLGNPPEYVDGIPSREAVELFGKCVVKANQTSDFLPVLENKCRRISVTDEHGHEIPSVLYLLRSDNESFYLFLCNTGHSRAQLGRPQTEDVAVTERKTAFDSVFIRGFGECFGLPIELEPSSGKMFAANATRKDGLWEIRTSFPALGSRLFVIPKEKRERTRCVLPARPVLKTIKRIRIAKNWWPITLSENNCLVLDRPRFKIGSAAWMGPEEILRIDGRVRDALGLKHRGGSMVQPWAQKERSDGKKEKVELKYEFNVEKIPSGDVFLAVERPDLHEIDVNGAALASDMECGWWVDRSLRKIPLPFGALKLGSNEIGLKCKYTPQHPGLEIIYLLGAFGVSLRKGKGCLTEMPRFLHLGDWCRQGLPFYAGSVSYTCQMRCAVQHGRRIVLRVPEYAGVAVKVWVDGREAGYAAWPPYEVDITPWLGAENRRHELRMEVLGHRRNSHGPLHHADKHPVWTGPAEFITKDNLWRDDYQLVPCGLQRPPELVILETNPRKKGNPSRNCHV